jgi:hypothetical protein
MATMEHNPNPHFSKPHLKNLNHNNFKNIEVMGLQIIALSST